MKGLVQGGKYSWQQDFREPRKKFSHANKSWFTVSNDQALPFCVGSGCECSPRSIPEGWLYSWGQDYILSSLLFLRKSDTPVALCETENNNLHF